MIIILFFVKSLTHQYHRMPDLLYGRAYIYQLGFIIRH